MANINDITQIYNIDTFQLQCESHSRSPRFGQRRLSGDILLRCSGLFASPPQSYSAESALFVTVVGASTMAVLILLSMFQVEV